MRPMFTRINERGFIFAELAIGLPLIILMLWSMGHLFVGTWRTCRDLIADLTLQMEVRDAMSRIVDDMRSARHLEEYSNGVKIDSYLISGSEITKTVEPGAENRLPIYYYRDQNPDGRFCIYRQRRNGAKSDPITGGDILSDVSIERFKCGKIEGKARLWTVTIEAVSLISNHRFRLQTAVYAGGADR